MAESASIGWRSMDSQPEEHGSFEGREIEKGASAITKLVVSKKLIPSSKPIALMPGCIRVSRFPSSYTNSVYYRYIRPLEHSFAINSKLFHVYRIYAYGVCPRVEQRIINHQPCLVVHQPGSTPHDFPYANGLCVPQALLNAYPRHVQDFFYSNISGRGSLWKLRPPSS